MYGRHRNGLGIDHETGEGTVTGKGDGREYEIGPRADLRGADLRFADLAFANLTDADLVGASFMYAIADPGHIPLIEAATRDMISTIDVGRAPNPGQGTRRGPGGYKY